MKSFDLASIASGAAIALDYASRGLTFSNDDKNYILDLARHMEEKVIEREDPSWIVLYHKSLGLNVKYLEGLRCQLNLLGKDLRSYTERSSQELEELRDAAIDITRKALSLSGAKNYLAA